jgi:hypothetical protein
MQFWQNYRTVASYIHCALLQSVPAEGLHYAGWSSSKFKLRHSFVCRQWFFAVGAMATKLAARTEVRFPTWSRDFSLLQNVHTSCGAHRAPYSVCSEGAHCAAAHSPTPVPWLIMNGAVFPSPPYMRYPFLALRSLVSHAKCVMETFLVKTRSCQILIFWSNQRRWNG